MSLLFAAKQTHEYLVLFAAECCFYLLQNELMKEARTIVEERRSAVVMGMRGESGRDGVFQWVTGPPTAGKPATLAYNKNSDGLRNSQVPHINH